MLETEAVRSLERVALVVLALSDDVGFVRFFWAPEVSEVLQLSANIYLRRPAVAPGAPGDSKVTARSVTPWVADVLTIN